MSNINNEFERYWSSALNKAQEKSTFAKEQIKEFCRQMFIDIIVDERRSKDEIKYDRTGISGESNIAINP